MKTTYEERHEQILEDLWNAEADDYRLGDLGPAIRELNDYCSVPRSDRLHNALCDLVNELAHEMATDPERFWA